MDARFALQTPRMIVGLLALGIVGATVKVLFDVAVSRVRIVARS